MKFARELALTATLLGCLVSALPAQQEVDPTYYPPIAEPAAPSHQKPVAKKTKATASSVAHHKPGLKPVVKKQTSATVKPAVRK